MACFPSAALCGSRIIVCAGSHEKHGRTHRRQHRSRHRGDRPRRGLVLPLRRAGRVRRRGDALCARPRLDPAAGIGALRACRPVHAGRRLDAAGRRSCARRHLLRAGEAAHARRSSTSSARSSFCCPSPSRLSALSLPYVGALVGDSRRLAGDERPAVRLSAQDADPAVRAADRPARRRAGDPRRAGAAPGRRCADIERNPRRRDGGRRLRAAARRLSGGADARRRVARLCRAAARPRV